MALVDDLKQFAKDYFKDLEAAGPRYTRDEAKNLPVALMLMSADGLKLLSVAAQDFQDIAAEIEPKKAELNPLTTVYAAALGMQAVLNRIIVIWAYTTKPSGGAVPAEVTAAIDHDVPRYVKLVTH